jgi:hypothetical protein
MLRKIDKYSDFSFNDEKVHRFTVRIMAIDPVVHFKMIFLGYFYGIQVKISTTDSTDRCRSLFNLPCLINRSMVERLLSQYAEIRSEVHPSGAFPFARCFRSYVRYHIWKNVSIFDRLESSQFQQVLQPMGKMHRWLFLCWSDRRIIS